MKKMLLQLEKWYIVLLLIAIVFIMTITVHAFQGMIKDQQAHELDQISIVVANAISSSVESENLIQEFWIDKLEQISVVLVDEMKDVDFTLVGSDELYVIQERFALSGVALFRDLGDDIVIESSTHESEIGLSTKYWGFWHEAFRQLFDEGHVSKNRGYSKGPFWAGPRSLAYDQEGFFLFTYYAIPDTPYLLNLYVDDKKAFGMLKETDPNHLIKDLLQKSSFIDEIAVINTEAWNNRFMQEDRFKLQDFTIHYGAYRGFTAKDTYYLNQVNALDDFDYLTVDYKEEGQRYSKVYKKLADDQVIIFKVNHMSRNTLKNNLILTIVLGLVAISLLNYLITMFYTRKYSHLLSIERERLKTAESFKHTVKLLPSMVFRLQMAKDGIAVVHCEGKALSELGINPDESRNKLLKEVLPHAYIKELQKYLELAFEGKVQRLDFYHDEKIYDLQMERIEANDNDQETEILVFGNDITAIHESEKYARYLANHDSLTNMPNRLYFKEKVERAISGKNPFLLVFLDMDGFKYVNDTAGHDIGDLLIEELGRRIEKAIRANDFAARMGGDEFAILMGVDDAPDVLNQLAKAINAPYIISDFKFKLTSSIGVSAYPQDGEDYTSLLKKADIAMYEIKDQGKNGIRFYSEEVEQS